MSISVQEKWLLPGMALAILISLLWSVNLYAQAPSSAPSNTLTVQAYVDGEAELRIHKDYVYWYEGSKKACKPGRYNGANLPTYLNGVPWVPHWHNGDPKGRDKTDHYPISLSTLDLDFTLISVGINQGEKGIVPRTPANARKNGDDEYVVEIPDKEPGAMWYTFALTPVDWQKRAVADFPDLAKPDSDLNHKFIARVKELKASKPAYFNDPKWPYLLAQEVSGKQPDVTPTASPSPSPTLAALAALEPSPPSYQPDNDTHAMAQPELSPTNNSSGALADLGPHDRDELLRISRYESNINTDQLQRDVHNHDPVACFCEGIMTLRMNSEGTQTTKDGTSTLLIAMADFVQAEKGGLALASLYEGWMALALGSERNKGIDEIQLAAQKGSEMANDYLNRLAALPQSERKKFATRELRSLVKNMAAQDSDSSGN